MNLPLCDTEHADHIGIMNSLNYTCIVYITFQLVYGNFRVFWIQTQSRD